MKDLQIQLTENEVGDILDGVATKIARQAEERTYKEISKIIDQTVSQKVSARVDSIMENVMNGPIVLTDEYGKKKEAVTLEFLVEQKIKELAQKKQAWDIQRYVSDQIKDSVRKQIAPVLKKAADDVTKGITSQAATLFEQAVTKMLGK